MLINKVGPEALIVGSGVLRIIHCPVYYGSYGFEECRKKSVRDLTDLIRRMNRDLSILCHLVSLHNT